MAQSERPDRSRGQWILLGLLVLFAVVGGSFLGFIIETQVLNPPTQVVGICPAPAFVNGNDCVQKLCTTGSDNMQTCHLEEAGSIVGSGSRITCSNNVCVATP